LIYRFDVFARLRRLMGRDAAFSSYRLPKAPAPILAYINNFGTFRYHAALLTDERPSCFEE